MKKLIIMVISFGIFFQTEAALPPLYQTSREIKGLLEDVQLGQKLQSGERIEKIEKNDHGYLITTNKSQLQVNVEYKSSDQPGPVKYKIEFEDAIPLKS